MFITIQEQIRIIGSDGNYRAFLPNHQYDILGTSMLTINCIDCPNTPILHYEIKIDSITYYIPSLYSFISNVPIEEKYQDSLQRLEDRLIDHTTDVEPLYRKAIPGFTTLKQSYKLFYRDEYLVKDNENKNPGDK